MPAPKLSENPSPTSPMKHEIKDGELLLSPENDLISTTVQDHLKVVQSILDELPPVDKLTIHLDAVNAVDSQGLNLLVGIYQESRSRDWSFRIDGASPSIQRLFHFVKLSERFGLEHS